MHKNTILINVEIKPNFIPFQGQNSNNYNHSKHKYYLLNYFLVKKKCFNINQSYRYNLQQQSFNIYVNALIMYILFLYTNKYNFKLVIV